MTGSPLALSRRALLLAAPALLVAGCRGSDERAFRGRWNTRVWNEDVQLQVSFASRGGDRRLTLTIDGANGSQTTELPHPVEVRGDRVMMLAPWGEVEVMRLENDRLIFEFNEWRR